MTVRTSAIFLFLFICLNLLSPVSQARSAAPNNAPAISQATCDQMKARGVLAASAPVGCEKLAIVRFSYIDFDGQTHDDGEIMVMAAVTDFVKIIFDTLYSRRFPIARAKLMNHYSGDDLKAMQDNNTSAFNHRPITGGNLASLHAYGLAIDINPIQNPYIRFNSDGQAFFSPSAGVEYANRLNHRPGKPERPGMAEEVVELFAQNGFLVWGGFWDAPIDFQHFQVERNLAEHMAKLPIEQARALFTDYVQKYRKCLNRHQGKTAASIRIRCIENQK